MHSKKTDAGCSILLCYFSCSEGAKCRLTEQDLSVDEDLRLLTLDAFRMRRPDRQCQSVLFQKESLDPGARIVTYREDKWRIYCPLRGIVDPVSIMQDDDRFRSCPILPG